VQALVTRKDLEARYGLFHGFLVDEGRFDPSVPVPTHVTPDNVVAFLEDLRSRVSSVTLYGSIYKLRRMAEILRPDIDFAWLREIENDLDFLKLPNPKHHRVVLTEAIVKAALTFIEEAELTQGVTPLQRATRVRDGLMVALLALCPIRLRAFAALRVGTTFACISDRWWIVLRAEHTKSRRPDERPMARFLKPYLDRWIQVHRPLFPATGDALWPSIQGGPLTPSQIGRITRKITRQTLGVPMSPHVFRTAAASTAAVHAGDDLHLGASLLQHIDPRVTEEHYNRASDIHASLAFQDIIGGLEH
jgi:integrase